MVPIDSEMEGFCAAPWIDAVLYNNGALLTCCRNSTVFGNWIEDGLEKCWHSNSYQSFRDLIKRGQFPDNQCKNCYNNGTARSLTSVLDIPFFQNKQIIFNFIKKKIPAINAIKPIFKLRKKNKASDKILNDYLSSINKLKSKSLLYPPEINNAIMKLMVIGQITKMFLERDLSPPIIVPFRQVQLIAKCNARCIHCPGRYNGDIFNGPSLDEKYLEKAFSYTEDIIGFFMNGSEFLFYPDWKKIAGYLVKNGVKLSISTNGILLTKENINYLIDNKIIQELNISLDGATKESVESIRANVNYDRLIKNIAYLFSYAYKMKYDFDLSFSFVLMKRNYLEFPDLVKLIHELKMGNKRSKGGIISRFLHPNKYPTVNIFCQALENLEIPGYLDFIQEEHHSLVDREMLIQSFKTVMKESKNKGIPVTAFYSYKLKDFIKKGFPFPPLVEKI